MIDQTSSFFFSTVFPQGNILTLVKCDNNSLFLSFKSKHGICLESNTDKRKTPMVGFFLTYI